MIEVPTNHKERMRLLGLTVVERTRLQFAIAKRMHQGQGYDDLEALNDEQKKLADALRLK